MGRLDGKRVFITGASGGIGETIARRFAEQGATVILAARSLDKLEAIADDIRVRGGHALAVRMDQTVETMVEAAIETSVQAFGGIDALINNAAPLDLVVKQGMDGPVHGMSTEGFHSIMKGVLYGPFWCCKYALPHMMKGGTGSIINVSSIAAVTGVPAVPAYSAAKGGLSALTRSIAFDYGRFNIRCNAILLGTIGHERWSGMLDTPEKVETMKARHLTRLGVPDDVANAAIYLASDESEFVTGSHLSVEGGVLIKSRPETEVIRS